MIDPRMRIWLAREDGHFSICWVHQGWRSGAPSSKRRSHCQSSSHVLLEFSQHRKGEAKYDTIISLIGCEISKFYPVVEFRPPSHIVTFRTRVGRHPSVSGFFRNKYLGFWYPYGLIGTSPLISRQNFEYFLLHQSTLLLYDRLACSA